MQKCSAFFRDRIKVHVWNRGKGEADKAFQGVAAILSCVRGVSGCDGEWSIGWVVLSEILSQARRQARA